MATIKRKQLILNVGNELVRMWLKLYSGLTGFTDREIDVLEVLILKRNELVANQIRGKYLSELLFSTPSRKEFIDTLKITEFNLTNIISSLKKKKAITQVEGVDDIDSRLIPADELTIRFITNDNRTEDSGEIS